MKRVIAILLAAFMLVGYIPAVSAEEVPTEHMPALSKDEKPLSLDEKLVIEVLDGGDPVETVTAERSMVKLTKFEANKTYTLRAKSDKYDVLTKYMKVAKNELAGAILPHFLEDVNEELTPEKAMTIKLKDKVKEQDSAPAPAPAPAPGPKEALTAMLMLMEEGKSAPVPQGLKIEVLEGDKVLETLISEKKGTVTITKYDEGKTYTLRVKDSKYEVINKFMVVDSSEGMALPHFLEKEDEKISWSNVGEIKLKVKDPATTDPGQDSGDASDYVEIPDKLFLKVINKNLGPDRADDQRVTKAEMESLTMISHYLDEDGKPGIKNDSKVSILGKPKSLKGTDEFKFMVTYGIKSIEGIQYAKNLTQLKLNENEVVDISPLRDLTKLEYLEFSRNRVVDIRPIENLKNLTFLKLYNNWIEDVTPIAGLTKLKGLDLHYNVRAKMVDGKKIKSAGITDISSLKDLTNLEYLDLSENRIDDASVLLHFPNLNHLDISGNHVFTYEGMGSLITKLIKLSFAEKGSIMVAGQNVSLDSPVFVESNTVEFDAKFKGFEEVLIGLMKAYNDEDFSADDLNDKDLLETIQGNLFIMSDKKGVEASYVLESSKVRLNLTDKFINENKGKDVNLKLSINFAGEYGWVLEANLKVMGGEVTPPTAGLKELPIKVEYKGRPVNDFKLGIYTLVGIPNLLFQPQTNEDGMVVLKDLLPNHKYEIRSRINKVYFEQETFVFTTNAKAEVNSIDGKSVKEFPNGIVFKIVDKDDPNNKTVSISFKTVDAKTGEPVKGVVLTANTINPNLGSYKDETSNEKGIVEFKLLGSPTGKNYSITVSKNGQFLWDFVPEEIGVIAYSDRCVIIPTKGNEKKENILRVTYNDRRYLRADLAEIIKKAKELIASGKYTETSLKALELAVQGGEIELKLASTIPYYVQGHITNIEGLIKKLVLKDEYLPKTENSDTSNTSNTVDTYTEYTGPVEKRGEVKVEKKEEIKADKAENKVEEPEVEIVLNPPSIPFGMIDIAVTPAQDAIKNTVERGILKGVAANRFEPKLPVSRAMVTEVLMRLAADKSVNDSIVFSDVNKDSWYAKSVKWAASHNIIKGYKDGTFRADKKVSLQEFAYMLKDYGKKMPKTVSVDRSMYSYLPEWSREAVIALVEVGLIEVSQTGKNAFDGEITREYLAVVIDKLIRFTEESIAK